MIAHHCGKVSIRIFLVGQGHRVQFSQLHHMMANAKIYKCLQHIFELALTVSEI